MMLKSFGCSFIFGSDLHDSADQLINYNKPVPSQFTWPALLAKDHSMDYKCFASPGSGNLKIYDKVLSQSITSKKSIFVIGWSFIDRFDYLTNTFTTGHFDPVGNQYWSTISPGAENQLSLNYYQNIHSQYVDKINTLTYITGAINTLKEKNIPFIMTYIDDLIFETKWHTSPGILELQNYIRPYMTKFENKTFLDWTKEKGFPISETLHPLEEAHQAAFELIKSYNLV